MIIVDLTNPNIGIPVVRAIVPGLETFEVTESVMGRRARDTIGQLSSVILNRIKRRRARPGVIEDNNSKKMRL